MSIGKTLPKPSREICSAHSCGSAIGHRVLCLRKGIIVWRHPLLRVMDELKGRHQAVLTDISGLQWSLYISQASM